MEQFQNADVPIFVKQLGAKPVAEGAWRGEYRELDDLRALGNWKDKKGGNPDEWPAGLRVREYPTEAAV